jgi:LCP family protein required for cell wall assembly
VLPARPRAARVSPPASQPRPLDMALPGPTSPWRARTFVRGAKARRGRRWAFRGTAAALVLVITLGGLLFSQGYLKAHKVFKGGAGTVAALNADVNPDLLKGEGRGRINILLLGRGGGNHNAPDLTDTLILASIDPVNHTASLVSLPRDLWVKVPGQGSMKLNAAWQTGVFQYLGETSSGSTDAKAIAAGFKTVDQTVEEVLGLAVDYHVVVDFQAFQQAIDTVGGVAVNVPADLVDPTMAWENAWNPVLARAGPQSFDGKKALMYVRSRETSSDFARAERQRAMLVALKSKTISLGTLGNPLKISGLLDAFGDNVQTDLSLANAARLHDIVKDIDDSRVTSLGLSDKTAAYVTTGSINGQSVVLPKAGAFQYQGIRQFMRAQLPDPYIKKENAKILVLDSSPLLNAASQKAGELKSYGYNVIGTGRASQGKAAPTKLVDMRQGKYKYTKNYLEQRLATKAGARLSDPSMPTKGADFVIIIGNDEVSAPNH